MYQSFYKFSAKPFRLSPDPGFFFPSRGHKRALAYLRYGLNQDEGFVVITGAPGTGKTTLAKILLQELGDKDLVVAHLTTTQLEADDMLRMVAASFGLRYESMDKAALLKSLEQFLIARARERKRALLVIDEAQNLPQRSLEELRMLSNLQFGDKALVQTFLLGQAQFRQMLDHPDLEQLRQRVIANYHLSPLAIDECQRYIESRLYHVSWNNDPKFAEVAFELIHTHTEGIPRRINMLCDRILLFSCMEELHEITGEVVSLVIKELEQEISGELVKAESDPESKKQLEKIRASKAKAQEAAKAGLTVQANKVDTKAKTATKESATNEKAQAKPSDSKSSHAQRVEKLSEKIKSDSQADSEVMGNTVIKKKPHDTESAPAPDTSSQDIDERDLFRVIPGGKNGVDQPAKDAGSFTRPMAPAASGAQQPSQEDVVLRRILRLVLAFHRSPSRFPGLDNANQPLPDGITELLELAVSEDQVLTKVSPAAVMGISPMMLRAAVRFFVRRAFFVVDGDDYRVLGLLPSAAQQLIERHYDLLMRLLRQDKQRGSADSVARIGHAYESLNRLDQSAQKTRQPSAATQAPVPAPTPPPAATQAKVGKQDVIEVGDGDLTIDFDEITKLPERRLPKSPFGKKPYENFDTEKAISQKRLRNAGQIAVLGFGALVIVLGMYIVQLEPSEVESPEVTTISKNLPLDKSASDSERLSLSFSDGSSNQSNDPDQFERLATADKAVIVEQNFDDEPAVVPAPESYNDDTAVVPGLFAGDVASDTEAVMAKEPTTGAEFVAPQSPRPLIADIEIEDVTNDNIATGSTDSKVDTDTNKNIAGSSVRPQSYPGIDIEVVSDETTATTAAARVPTTLSDQTKVSESQQSSVNTATASPTLAATPKVASQSSELVTLPVPPVASQQTAQAKPVPEKTTAKISEKELNTFISRFVGAYKKGDINKVMGLFAKNARTNNRTTNDGIRADYLELFKSTSFREMKVSSLFWEFDDGFARGVGEYQARVSATGASGAQTFFGKITMQIHKRGNNLKLTRFYFSNEKVVAGAGAVTQSDVPVKGIAQDISETELKATMSQFIQYYESGDLESLIALFAENARTNDRSSRQGIRQDHIDLFASTSQRKMSISNMKWKNGPNLATGSGGFEVVIQAVNSDVSNKYTGVIKIQAIRTNNGILITQMLHNTQ